MFHLQNEGIEKNEENATEGEPPSKKTKLTGRNKKRPKGKRIQAFEKICPAVVRDQTCSYGNSCKFSHDKSKFMETKISDISDQCYMFETYGKCPFGLACRFGAKHITEDFRNIVKENLNEEKLNSSVKNVLKKDNQVLLWKRKYDFSKANAVIDEMGCRNPKEKQGGKNSGKDEKKDTKPDKTENDSVMLKSDKVLDQEENSVAQNKDSSHNTSKDDIRLSDGNVNSNCDTGSAEKTADKVTDTDKINADENGKSNVSNSVDMNVKSVMIQRPNDESDVAKLKDTERVANYSGAVEHTSSQMQRNEHSEDVQNKETKSFSATTSEKNGAFDSVKCGVGEDEGVIRLRPVEKKKVWIQYI